MVFNDVILKTIQPLECSSMSSTSGLSRGYGWKKQCYSDMKSELWSMMISLAIILTW